MRSRLAVLLILLIGVVGLGLWHWRHAPHAAPDARPTAGAQLVSEPDRRLDLSAVHTRDSLEAVLTAAYRLPADRRMVAAAADVRALVSPGDTHARTHADWSGDRWTVRCGSDAVGALPEYPRFADAVAVLEDWAKRECTRRPIPLGTPEGIATGFLDDFLPEEALQHLDDVAQRSGLTRATLAQALTACTQLALLLAEDRTEFSDTTATRALALLALTCAGDGKPHAHEQCVLAWAMGYREEARTIAAALPTLDPLRLLVSGQAHALEQLANAPQASREARIDNLLLLAHRGLVGPWLAIARQSGGPGQDEDRAVLATALGFRRFDVGRVIGRSLLAAALVNVPDAPADPDADAATLLAFEREMDRPERGARGRLSGGAVSAAARAEFYSGLAAEHDFLAEHLASPFAVMQMSRALLPASAGPGAWFVRWQAHEADAMNGRANAQQLRADIDNVRIPAPLARVAFCSLIGPMRRAIIPARAAARALARRLDTRPRSAYEFASITQETVGWPALTERLLEHAARELGTDEPGTVILLALMREDVPRLSSIAADPAVDPDDAMLALCEWVEADSSAAESLIPRFAQLCARAPERWSLTGAYAELLEARGRFGAGERAVRAWMAAADSTQDALDSTVAVTALARFQRKQGRVADALVTMGHLERGQKRDAMEEKATLLALSGHGNEALALADSLVSRYPDGEAAHAFAVLMRWRVGRYDDAARMLARPGADSVISGYEFANGFAEIFRGRHEDALKAVAAMRAASPSSAHHVWWIAQAFARGGDAAFAASLAMQSDPGSGTKRAVGLANAFDLIAAAQGETPAWRWLETQRMGPDARELLGGLLLTRGHPVSAYELTAQGETADTDEYAWLLRAAAWKLDGARRTDWRDAIRAHAAHAAPSVYSKLTRFMLGELEEPDVLALVDSQKHENEVWFYCSLRAWAEGRARDTLLWTVLCQEAGSTSDGECIWSYAKLIDWSRAWRVPERLHLTAQPRV